MKVQLKSNKVMKFGVREVFWNHIRLPTLGLKLWGVFCKQRVTNEGL